MTKQCKNLTEGQKWVVSLYMLLLFLLIASPFIYRLTNIFTRIFGWTSSYGGKPNLSGLILHAVIFAVLVRVVMLIPLPGKKTENYTHCYDVPPEGCRGNAVRDGDKCCTTVNPISQCAGRPNGTSCGNNLMCMNGLCIPKK